MQDRKIVTQDLTIDALQVMKSERFVTVEKNLEAINPGIVPAVGVSMTTQHLVRCEAHNK